MRIPNNFQLEVGFKVFSERVQMSDIVCVGLGCKFIQSRNSFFIKKQSIHRFNTQKGEIGTKIKKQFKIFFISIFSKIKKKKKCKKKKYLKKDEHHSVCVIKKKVLSIIINFKFFEGRKKNIFLSIFFHVWKISQSYNKKNSGKKKKMKKKKKM